MLAHFADVQRDWDLQLGQSQLQLLQVQAVLVLVDGVGNNSGGENSRGAVAVYQLAVDGAIAQRLDGEGVLWCLGQEGADPAEHLAFVGRWRAVVLARSVAPEMVGIGHAVKVYS